MATYSLDSPTTFIFCSTEQHIKVYENKALYACNITNSDWDGPLKYIDVSKDQLKVFNVVISGQSLKELAVDLCENQWTVNNEGHCYLYIHSQRRNVRCNDLFGWSKYGVTPSITVVWNRYDMHSKKPVINYTEEHKELEDFKSQLQKAEEKISLQKKELEKKDQELKEKDNQLLAEQKQVDGLKVEMSCLKGQIDCLEEKMSLCEKGNSGDKNSKRVAALVMVVNSLLKSLCVLNNTLQKEYDYQPDIFSLDGHQGNENDVAEILARLGL